VADTKQKAGAAGTNKTIRRNDKTLTLRRGF